MLRFVRRELFYEPGRAPKPDIYQINRKIADSGDRTRAAFETGALGRGRYQLRHARVVTIGQECSCKNWLHGAMVTRRIPDPKIGSIFLVSYHNEPC